MGLARCLYRDADLVIMDEPTSALDPTHEMRFFEEIKALKEDRIVILVTHRFSTVRMADRIYVMDKGTIVETGTHFELVQHGGKYAEMYRLHMDLLTEEV